MVEQSFPTLALLRFRNVELFVWGAIRYIVGYLVASLASAHSCQWQPLQVVTTKMSPLPNPSPLHIQNHCSKGKKEQDPLRQLNKGTKLRLQVERVCVRREY